MLDTEWNSPLIEFLLLEIIHISCGTSHSLWQIWRDIFKEYEMIQENLQILHWYIVICLALTSVQSIILFYIYINTINMNSYANLLFQSFICALILIFCLFILFVVLTREMLSFVQYYKKCPGWRDFVLFFLCPIVSLFLFCSQYTLRLRLLIKIWNHGHGGCWFLAGFKIKN